MTDILLQNCSADSIIITYIFIFLYNFFNSRVIAEFGTFQNCMQRTYKYNHEDINVKLSQGYDH